MYCTRTKIEGNELLKRCNIYLCETIKMREGNLLHQLVKIFKKISEGAKSRISFTRRKKIKGFSGMI
jgi:hypothetical protein